MPVEYWAKQLVDRLRSSRKSGNVLLLKKSADVRPIRAKSGSDLHRGQTSVTDAISEGNSAILVAPFISTVLNNTDGNSLSFYVLRWIR